MPNMPVKTLGQYAADLEARASYLMNNRTHLDLDDLYDERTKLSNLRYSIAPQLSGKQQRNFDANMDKVEDILDGLIRQIEFNNHTGDNFTGDIRRLSSFLRSAAALLSTLATLFFSIHSHS